MRVRQESNDGECAAGDGACQGTIRKVWKAEELAQHDGSTEGKPLLLAILGKVYDVSKGAKHYGKGGSYSFFSGRDGTRAFITGKFNAEGLIPDISGLTPEQAFDINEWQDFYHTDYTYVGLLEGHYYNADGSPTAAVADAKALIAEGKRVRAEGKDLRDKYPPCNVRSAQGTPSVVWCTTLSGGIQRDWVGVPRELFHPKEGSKRCACMSDETLVAAAAMIKEYPDCAPTSIECTLPGTGL